MPRRNRCAKAHLRCEFCSDERRDISISFRTKKELDDHLKYMHGVVYDGNPIAWGKRDWLTGQPGWPA